MEKAPICIGAFFVHSALRAVVERT